MSLSGLDSPFQPVYTIVAGYELMLLGEESAFQDLSGLRGEVCFGLESTSTSCGSLALLWMRPLVFDLSSHPTIPHVTAFVIGIAFQLFT